MNSFAFPNGLYLPYQINELLKYYKILRLFDNNFRLYSPEEIAEKRVIYGQSIDKGKFKDDNVFREKIFKRLLIAKLTDKVYSCTSHYIGQLENDAYTISDENFRWLLKTINDLKLNSYTFSSFYNLING